MADLFSLLLPNQWKEVKLKERKSCHEAFPWLHGVTNGIKLLQAAASRAAGRRVICIRAAAEDPACTSDARRDGTDMAVRLDAVLLSTRRKAITYFLHVMQNDIPVLYHVSIEENETNVSSLKQMFAYSSHTLRRGNTTMERRRQPKE